MGRRATRSPMGLSHYQKEINKRNRISLAYESEAIIPPHTTIPSMSIKMHNNDKNYEEMKTNLVLLKEKWEHAIVRVAAYQQQLMSYYHKREQFSFQQMTNSTPLQLKESLIFYSMKSSRKITLDRGRHKVG